MSSLCSEEVVKRSQEGGLPYGMEVSAHRLA